MSDATTPTPNPPGEVSIDAMLERINRMAAGEQVPPMPPPVAAAPPMSAAPVPVAAVPVSTEPAPLVTAPPPPGVAPLPASAIVPAPAPADPSAAEDSSNTFYPAEPQRREDLGISEAAVEEIAVKVHARQRRRVDARNKQSARNHFQHCRAHSSRVLKTTSIWATSTKPR